MNYAKFAVLILIGAGALTVVDHALHVPSMPFWVATTLLVTHIVWGALLYMCMRRWNIFGISNM